MNKINKMKKFSGLNTCPSEEKGNLTSQKSEVVINCFYQCPFTAPESPLMEKHYQQKHYQKEAIGG